MEIFPKIFARFLKIVPNFIFGKLGHIESYKMKEYASDESRILVADLA